MCERIKLVEVPETTSINLKCRGCDHVWTFSGPRLEAFDQACPACGSTAVARDWRDEKDAKGDFVWRERTFYGEVTESRMHGCHPSEVEAYRALLGGEEGRCVKHDGSVHFRTRTQQREFSNRVAQLMREGKMFNPAMGHV